MSKARMALRLLRKHAATAVFVAVVLAPVVWFYSVRSDYSRKKNVLVTFRYGLDVAKAVTAFKNSNGYMPPSATALKSLPLRPAQTADWTLDQGSGFIRLRVAEAPRDADTLELVPSTGPTGQLVYSCRSLNVPAKYSPQECKGTEEP